MWSSFIPLILEIYLFCKFVENNYFLFILLLPIQICVGYIVLVFSSLLVSKIFLSFVNIFHKPKEGVFRRVKSDKDYYFWCLRSILRKWPIWIVNLVHLSFFTNLLLKIFGIKTNFSNALVDGKIDCEFIELGKNVTIGKGCFIKSCMIFREYLIIKKTSIADNVVIGSQSYISPGTVIGSNSFVAAFSVTKLGQNLEPDSIYNGCPAEKTGLNFKDELQLKSILEKIVFGHPSPKRLYDSTPINNEKYEGKFVKKIPTFLLIFFIIYIFAYGIPLLILIYFYIDFFNPLILKSPTIIDIFINSDSIIVLSLTPIILIGCFLIHLILLSIITKIFYKLITHFNPPSEGVYHWEKRNKDYVDYFIRSFLIRYIKWKILRSPFPWLIKSIFNFIGNCKIGKKTVIEDMFIAKEFLEVGSNSYLGKIMIANQLWDNNLTIKKIIIKNHVVVSDGTCIAPGTKIENNVSIIPLSITAKCDILTSQSIYYSAPIKKIDEEYLSELFNINLLELKKQKK